MTLTVLNQGDAASPATKGLVHTSTSGSHIIPGKDTLRRTFNIPALQPGQSVTIVVKFKAPAATYLVGADVVTAGNKTAPGTTSTPTSLDCTETS